MGDRKRYELALGYFKKGDDLHGFLDLVQDASEPNKSAAALLEHAKMLESDAQTLRRAAMLAADGHLEVSCADTHFIELEVDADACASMICAGDMYPPPFDDEDEEDDMEDEDMEDEDLDDDEFEDTEDLSQEVY